MQEKRCTKCGETKPQDAFQRHKSTADGLRPECCACASEYQRKYRQRNAVQLKRQKADWAKRIQPRRRKPCLICGGPKPAGERRRYCDPCAEIAAEIAAESNRLRASGWSAITRMVDRQYGTPRKLSKGFIEDVHPLIVIERADGVCGICGGDVDPLNFHVDHIVPLSKGGEHSYANTQAAHPHCNISKGAKVP